MSYTYCSKCHDAICTCGEKYQGMSSVELTELIDMLSALRDKQAVRESIPVDPDAVKAWRREQMQKTVDVMSPHLRPRGR